MSCVNDQRKLNRKSAAFPAFRRPIDPSAMFVNDLLRMRKTEPSAVALGCEERNEKISGFFVGHAMTVVADRYQGLRASPFRRDGQLSSARHRVHRIADQIQESFPNLLRVCMNRGQIRIKYLTQSYLFLLKQRLHKI